VKTAVNNVQLLKLKLLLINDNITTIHFDPVFTNVQPLNLYAGLFSKAPFFSGLVLTHKALALFLYHHLSLFKLKQFKTIVNLSRFTTLNHRITDYRFRAPKLMEFEFSVEGIPSFLNLATQAKLTVDFFINPVDFSSFFYTNFYKRFYNEELEPYEKKIPVAFRKTWAKRFSFNFYKTYTHESIGLFIFFSMMYFNLFQYLIFKLEAPFFTPFFFPFFDVAPYYCMVGAFLFAHKNLNLLKQFLVNAPGKTGLLTFKDLRDLRTDTSKYDFVRHFGYYYPYTSKETYTPGASKRISPWHLGKLTYFFFLTKKMLVRSRPKTIGVAYPFFSRVSTVFKTPCLARILPNLMTPVLSYKYIRTFKLKN